MPLRLSRLHRGPLGRMQQVGGARAQSDHLTVALNPVLIAISGKPCLETDQCPFSVLVSATAVPLGSEALSACCRD